jgi:hypothetical protein
VPCLSVPPAPFPAARCTRRGPARDGRPGWVVRGAACGTPVPYSWAPASALNLVLTVLSAQPPRVFAYKVGCGPSKASFVGLGAVRPCVCAGRGGAQFSGCGCCLVVVVAPATTGCWRRANHQHVRVADVPVRPSPRRQLHHDRSGGCSPQHVRHRGGHNGAVHTVVVSQRCVWACVHAWALSSGVGGGAGAGYHNHRTARGPSYLPYCHTHIHGARCIILHPLPLLSPTPRLYTIPLTLNYHRTHTPRHPDPTPEQHHPPATG